MSCGGLGLLIWDYGDIMAAEIRLFPCLTDNFGYLVHDPVSKAVASIDAAVTRDSAPNVISD